LINFRKIRFRNFLSYGDNFTEIELDKHSTTLITGGNGSGKSVLLDAMSFVLYGKSFRSITKPLLVNAINTKACIVEIEIEIAEVHYLIRRGIKPNLFEIIENGDKLDALSASDMQDYLEANILKMNYQAFNQVVMLGKATYTPFMKLKTPQRREIVEELLGLKIFTKMRDILKSQIKENKANVLLLSKDEGHVEDKIEIQEVAIEKMDENVNEQIKEIEGAIWTLEQEQAELELEQDEIARKGKDLDHSKRTKTQKQLTDMFVYEAKFVTKIQDEQDTINFYAENDSCEVCKQSITEEFKETAIEFSKDRLKKFSRGKQELSIKAEDVKKQLEILTEIYERSRTLQNEHIVVTGKIRSINRQITPLRSKIDLLNKPEEDSDLVGKLHEMQVQLKIIKQDYADAKELTLYQGAMTDLLKDTGIKAQIINKYIPIFNKLINEYLNKMNLHLSFELDDQFNETILSRYRDNYTYTSFSEGEKLRIDLAILLTWIDIAKMKNALNTNLLIMDEIFDSSLDQAGVDSFIELIPAMGDVSIFVISHTPDKLIDKFRCNLNVKKVDNFSEIEEV